MASDIGIVGHVSRLDAVWALKDLLGPAVVSVDDGALGCNGNHLAVWRELQHGSKADWLLIIEDDSEPVYDFLNQLDAVLEAAPSPLVSLYRGHHVNNMRADARGAQITETADEQGANWIMHPELLHAVAIGLQIEFVSAMVSHVALLPANFPIDQAISHWARAAGITTAYCHPSLIEHSDGESTFRHPDKLPRPKGRTAYRVGTRDTWNSESVQF